MWLMLLVVHPNVVISFMISKLQWLLNLLNIVNFLMDKG